MPIISNFYGIVIYMFFREHNPPHFHAKYQDYEVQIAIENLQILKGTLPPKAIGLVMEWAMLHQTELIDNWQRMNRGEQWNKIEPIK